MLRTAGFELGSQNNPTVSCAGQWIVGGAALYSNNGNTMSEQFPGICYFGFRSTMKPPFR
jgi:hypothetical protein